MLLWLEALAHRLAARRQRPLGGSKARYVLGCDGGPIAKVSALSIPGRLFVTGMDRPAAAKQRGLPRLALPHVRSPRGYAILRNERMVAPAVKAAHDIPCRPQPCRTPVAAQLVGCDLQH